MAPRFHRLVRLFALVAIVASLTYVAQRSNLRSDLTAEGLSQLTPATRELISSIGGEYKPAGAEEARTLPPVVVTAFVSAEVPRAYVPLRSRLLNVLNEMEASGGDGMRVRIVEPKPFSEEAQEAVEKYGIVPRPLVNAEGGEVETMQVFLGVAFTSGPREEVVPFFDRGLSVEYEIVRALEVVTQERKKVVGIIRDDTKIMGDFDLQARRQIPRWRIVEELEKQYEVRGLNPGTPIPDDVDMLLVPQLSSQTQASLDIIQGYLFAGRPALIVVDPLPLANPQLAPPEPMLAPPGQGMMGGGAPPQPKGDYRGLLRSIGVEWSDENIVWDFENPEKQFKLQRSFVVVGKREGESTFAGKGNVVEGLAQVLVLLGGDLRPSGSETEFQPLLVTGRKSGWDRYEDYVESHPLFGPQIRGIPEKPRAYVGERGAERMVLAARITGGGAAVSTGEGEEASERRPVNVAVVADLDMFSDTFFQFHERGGDVDGDGIIDMRFDNVTFLLNLIDSLVGDERFIELRKRQPAYRRLELVAEKTEAADEAREEQIRVANEAAEDKIATAQAALDEAVAAIQAQTELDETTKKIMIRSAEEAENRRLKAQTEQIEREKAQQLDRIQAEHARAVDEVRDRFRLGAILWPPVPAILMGLVIFVLKRRRERSTIPQTRLRKDA